MKIFQSQKFMPASKLMGTGRNLDLEDAPIEP